MEKPYYRGTTSLVIGGPQTQVLADSIAIASSAKPLRHLSKSSIIANLTMSHNFYYNFAISTIYTIYFATFITI